MRKWMWFVVATLAVLCSLTIGVRSAVGESGATVSTDQKMYSVGEGMVISGKGFSPQAQINISVQRPDQTLDQISGVISDASGGFAANYAPPNEPGRYRITATDGVNTATSATTEADAIGYNKGVYDKNDTSYPGGAGHWTTGNAGSNYLEGQWAFYQYEFTGIGTAIPNADVAYNHFQSNTSAIFVDGFANFRACLDCADNTNLNGPSQGMLLDGVFAPPTLTTNWADAHSAISLINHPFDSANTCTAAIDPANSPSADHCFHIDGDALKSLINAAVNAKQGTQNVDYFATGTHTVTLYYAAHLAATKTWSKGKESLLGCSSDSNFIITTGQGAEFIPANTVFGTNVYNSTVGPCGADVNSWNSSSFSGIGSATGSSRHFSLENQSLGSQGGIDLPIPSVPGPTGSITIVKVTNPSPAVGASFNFNGDLGSFSLDTDPATATPSSTTFSGLSGGVTFNVSESSLPVGWQNTNLVCVNNTGTSTFVVTQSLTGGTVAITLPTTSNAAATCTFTNVAQASLQLVKNVSNANGGAATASQWTLSANGPTPIAGAGGVGPSLVTPGSYSLSETGSVAGYTNGTTYACVTTPLGGSAGAPVNTNSITLAGGDSAVCTITNHDNPAHLALVKQVNNNNGGTATASQWTLAAAGPTPLSGAGGVASTAVQAGSYNLSESGTVAGYTNGTSYNCTGTRADNSAISLTGVSSISLGVGDSATCTIINSDAPAHLALVKNVNNANGGTATASQWTLTAAGPTPLSGAGGVALTAVQAGSYNLSESGSVAGYTNGTSYNCTGTRADNSVISLNGVTSISLGVGDSATCAITNHDSPAHLTLVKNVQNNFGGNAAASNWLLSATGPTNISGAGGASSNVLAGAYTLGETGAVAGYTNGAAYSCVRTPAGGAALPAVVGNSIALGVGDAAVCTITNHDNPATIILVKNTTGGDATFPFNIGGPVPSQQQVTTTGGTGTVSVTNLPTGSYTVDEATPAGWTLTDLVCTVTGSQTVTGAPTQFNAQNIPTQWGFGLPLGGSVTCAAVNSAAFTTRTQGFWSTHTGLANAVWTGVNLPSGATPVAGSGDDLLCTVNPITAVALPGQNELMGGFWSNISQTSGHGKRTPLDQARMQMLQQYLAAVLNVHMFGAGSETMLSTARAAYCGNDANAIKSQVGILGTFNTSGDSGVFTPGSSATAQASKSQANIPFWDVTFE